MQSLIKDIKRRPAQPVTEAATTAEAKTWCIITNSDDDALIASLIQVARAQVENKTRVSIVEWEVVVTVDIKDAFPLPWGPVKSITSIERRDGATDDDPDWQTLTNEDYRIDGEDFKAISGLRCGVHRITYTCGYGEENPVPDDLKNAILSQVAFLYENRGDNNSKGKFSEVARSLLSGYIDYSHV